MAEQIGIFSGKIFDVRVVGVGKGIKRQTPSGARKYLFNASHFTNENRVPAFDKLGVGELDAQRGAQSGKEFRIADLALFVASIELVALKPRHQMCRITSGVTGPKGERAGEIEIKHDAAEIEQQCIGSAGR